jgi:hypothetical protein
MNCVNHPDRPVRSRGLCNGCYSAIRFKEKHAVVSRSGYEGKKATCHPDRPHYAKGMCTSCYEKHRYQTHEPRKRQRYKRARSYYASNKETIRWRDIGARFGVSREQYAVLLAQQNGGCAICGDIPENQTDGCLVVDHDHRCCKSRRKTCGKCVRALLCVGCNAGIGTFKDRIDLIKNAIVYLKRGAIAQWLGNRQDCL